MIPEKMLELLIFMNIEARTQENNELNEWILDNFDDLKINLRYFALLKEFLTDYAIDTQEKS